MKMTTEPGLITDAIMLILANTPSFTDCKNEHGLLRSLLHRLWSQVEGDDSEFDYWGRSANSFATCMLEAKELPE
jgi:hypothetical protein